MIGDSAAIVLSISELSAKAKFDVSLGLASKESGSVVYVPVTDQFVFGQLAG
jgi:hypothetical protein